MVDGLVRRYRAIDGLTGEEGVFLACSFWLGDCYELVGRHDEALALFRRLCALANDVELLAEEYDIVNKHQLGNFPQAFTHLALVNTAFNVLPQLEPMPSRTPEVERSDTTAASFTRTALFSETAA